MTTRPDDVATRRRVIDAATTTILECGYYRASSNEIARRAEVTWGVIQHYFGTRERLMMAVMQDWSETFADTVQRADVRGATSSERLAKLLDVLADLYGTPAYLAHLQILLNLDRDPGTGAEVRASTQALVARTNDHVRHLLHDALGPAAGVQHLATTLFHTMRGFVLSQQLLDAMGYDSPGRSRAVAAQRRLLLDILAPYVEA